jgi:hypothetical protein
MRIYVILQLLNSSLKEDWFWWDISIQRFGIRVWDIAENTFRSPQGVGQKTSQTIFLLSGEVCTIGALYEA